MSTALESLVQGEIMQIKTGEDDLLDMMTYLRKSYHKVGEILRSILPPPPSSSILSPPHLRLFLPWLPSSLECIRCFSPPLPPPRFLLLTREQTASLICDACKSCAILAG
eukprot:768574-Hanusia_phi.AAC.3